jgi:hypothetical protein
MSLPKRYALSVEVKLVELPNQFDPPEEPFTFSTDDPMKQAAEIMNRATRVVVPANPYGYGQLAAGFDYRKTCTVSVADFMGLSRIICSFDELTKDVEEHNP